MKKGLIFFLLILLIGQVLFIVHILYHETAPEFLMRESESKETEGEDIVVPDDIEMIKRYLRAKGISFDESDFICYVYSSISDVVEYRMIIDEKTWTILVSHERQAPWVFALNETEEQ